MPIILKGAETYLLPMAEGEELMESLDPSGEAPEKIRWDRVSSLTEGVKVFVGGKTVRQEDRLVFRGTKESPLLIIFYDGKDRSLTIRTIRAGRNKNEYWNPITPYSFIAGVFSQLMVAMYYLSRPIFRFTVIAAGIALFTPLLPLFPPGVICTLLYQRLWRQARIFRAYRDILQLPLNYTAPKLQDCRLPNGERYGGVYYDDLPADIVDLQIPMLIPNKNKKELKTKAPPQGLSQKEGWYVFGSLPEEPRSPMSLPQEPLDPFAPFGAVPGNPETLARRYTQKAYLLEICSWFLLIAGLGLNLFFIMTILSIIGLC
jgi:hypothetical protein